MAQLSRLGRLLAALAILPLASPTALAQRAPSPAQPPADTTSPRRPPAHVAGRFDYYTLVLSWSPTYCAGLPRNDYDPQCHRRDGRRYAFVLHGLWPQYERGYPERCPTDARPFVPQSTIDRMQDIMPSPRLTIHEYRKHGTCTGLPPDAYYDLARRLFAKVKVPPRYVLPAAPFLVSPGELVQEIVAANPGLRPDMLAVVCNGSGNRLREVRVCFTRESEYRACGSNESQRRLCSAARMFVPPVRPSSSSTTPYGSEPRAAPPPPPLRPGEQRL